MPIEYTVNIDRDDYSTNVAGIIRAFTKKVGTCRRTTAEITRATDMGSLYTQSQYVFSFPYQGSWTTFSYLANDFERELVEATHASRIDSSWQDSAMRMTFPITN